MTVNDRGIELASVLGLFLGLATIFVSLRCYVRLFLSKSWGVDDGLLIVAWGFFATYCACSAIGVHYGTGKHVDHIPLDDIPTAMYFWWLCELFYTLTTVFIRLSIAGFLLRTCVKPIHRYIIYGTLIMVIVYSTFYFFLVLFQCTPYTYFWAQYAGKEGSCINPAAVPDASIAHSVVSWTADWILGLLPIVLIWDLKMNIRTKVSAGFLLGLGLLAGIAALIRIPYIKVLSFTDDFLFVTTDVAIWSTIEPGLGITAIGGATLRPLFRSLYNLSTYKPSHPSSSTIPRRSSRVPKSSIVYRHEEDDIPLRNDVLEGTKGTVTSIRSPFGDSRESVDGNGGGRREEGVIKVHKTVSVSRVEVDGDGSPPFGNTSSRWGTSAYRYGYGYGHRERDLV